MTINFKTISDVNKKNNLLYILDKEMYNLSGVYIEKIQSNQLHPNANWLNLFIFYNLKKID